VLPEKTITVQYILETDEEISELQIQMIKKKIKLNRITLYLCCVHDRDCMVVGFTTTYEISTYHH
jgi:hypothetical protein